jgi:hypothetical protein
LDFVFEWTDTRAPSKVSEKGEEFKKMKREFFNDITKSSGSISSNSQGISQSSNINSNSSSSSSNEDSVTFEIPTDSPDDILGGVAQISVDTNLIDKDKVKKNDGETMVNQKSIATSAWDFPGVFFFIFFFVFFINSFSFFSTVQNDEKKGSFHSFEKSE